MQPCNNELQYACIFPLPAPRNCEDPLQPSCDCTDPANDNPLCADNPMGVGKTLQVNAKAYPGLRHLQLLRSLGGRGVVGSVCPPQLSDPNALGFGYRAAFAAVGDGISARLAP
jgi:hypothetical protein